MTDISAIGPKELKSAVSLMWTSFHSPLTFIRRLAKHTYANTSSLLTTFDHSHAQGNSCCVGNILPFFVTACRTLFKMSLSSMMYRVQMQ